MWYSNVRHRLVSDPLNTWARYIYLFSAQWISVTTTIEHYWYYYQLVYTPHTTAADDDDLTFRNDAP